MKKLINTKATVTGGKITICADIVEVDKSEFRFPTQQVTIGFINPANPRWPRHIQLSGDAVFVKSINGAFAITNDDLANIASMVEPKTSFSPFFKKMPSPKELTVDFSSELDPKIQWQQSDKADSDSAWSDIAGATSATLANPPAGKYVRCVASSDAGATATPAVKIP